MNTQTQAQLTSSLNILSVLGIAFIILKLTGHIAWSWWWVLAPFWGPTALFLAIVAGVLLCGLAVLVVTTVAMFFRKKK